MPLLKPTYWIVSICFFFTLFAGSVAAQENLGISTGPAVDSTFDGNRGTSSQAIESFTGGSQFPSFHGSVAGDVVGYRFTMNSEQAVESLGIWNADTDPGGAGLTSDHQIGIWDEAEVLIASVTVTPTSPAIGDFNYESIAPVVLTPGTTYTIGALYTADDGDSYISGPATLVSHPAVNTLDAVFPFEEELGFVFPTENSAGNAGRIGPNFLFGDPQPPLPESVPVPTLNSLGLIALLLALVGFALVVLRQKQA